MEAAAEDLNDPSPKYSPSINLLKNMAKQAQIYIIAGMIEKPDKKNGKPFNTAVVINPGG